MVTLLSEEQGEQLVLLEDLHSLQDAHIPGADLAQRPLLEAQVVSLTMVDPATWPSILVTRTKEYGLIVIDGYHRREAGTRLHLEAIRASIRAFGSEQEMIEAAFQANLTHGQPASTTTRSDYAYWLFTTYPDMKQNEIALRVGLKPPTVNAAIKRRARERQVAEEEQRRRALLLGWSEEDLAENDRKEARDKEIAQAIRAYMRQAKRLYTHLTELDDNGARYWTLEKAIDEGDKVMLYRLAQYLDSYLKASLPPDLAKSLKPTATRTRRAKSTSADTEASSIEQER